MLRLAHGRLQGLHGIRRFSALICSLLALSAFPVQAQLSTSLTGDSSQSSSPTGVTSLGRSGTTGTTTGSAGTATTQMPGVITIQQQTTLPGMQPGQQLPAGQQPGTLPGQPPMAAPSEFANYVQQMLDPTQPPIQRLGNNLLNQPPQDSPDASPLVPADYLLVPGDELQLSISGSVDADLRLVVDRSGRVVIPRVGPVMVAGVRYADVPDVIRQRVARQFKNFDVTVSLAQLRGIRVYVTGFATNPGLYSLNSLSTISAALSKAGGPSAAGSYRNIQLKRKGQAPVQFDLYELLVRGNRNTDAVLQPDDVVYVGPVGAEVAVLGSVNQQAIVELKPGETLKDAIEDVGGLNSVADSSSVTIERLKDRDGSYANRVPLPAGYREPLLAGDVIHVTSIVDAKAAQDSRNRRVVVEGEVAHPGAYVLPARATLQDALQAAGGLSPNAYVFGTQFSRTSVLKEQQDNYTRALRDLQVDLTRSASTQRTANADEAKAAAANQDAILRLITTLQGVKPTGRLVLQVTPGSSTLPDLALEDGDRIYIPAKPTSVSVFGSVFNAGSFVFAPDKALGDYLDQAGGPTRGADEKSAFVIRANGSVTSNLQSSSWFSSGSLASLTAQPGDTIFVPEEMNKTTLVQSLKDWSQIIYQLGLGAAAVHAVR